MNEIKNNPENEENKFCKTKENARMKEQTFGTGMENGDPVKKILEAENKQNSLLRIMMTANVILAAAVVIALLIIIPRVLSVAGEAETTLQEVNMLAGNAEKTLEGIDEVVQNANTTVGSAGKILEENAEEMEHALEHVNGIDFESLNKAINDLAQAVEPLTNLGRMFS